MNKDELREKIATALDPGAFSTQAEFHYMVEEARKVAFHRADVVLTAITEAGCTIVSEAYKAEMELLEEVCAIYTRDEDRHLKEGGEPYGSIPTECGMKARSAAQRFYDREVMLSSSPFKREE